MMMGRLVSIIVASVGTVGMIFARGSLDEMITVHLSILYDSGADATGETMLNLDRAKLLLHTDIGALLTESVDPERELAHYMGTIQKSLRQQSFNQQSLREKRDMALLRRKECVAQKQVSDREFFLEMKQGGSDSALDNVSQVSADAGACAEQARVKARAYGLMLEQTLETTRALEQRLHILRNNETFLLQHRTLIDTDPTTIIQVNRIVEQLE